MATQAFRFAVASAILLLATMFASPSAHAQVSGGGDLPGAAPPSVQSMPVVVDLASDPEWQTREFERNGVRFLLINDADDNARAVIARIGANAWVVEPAIQPPVAARTVYRDQQVEVIHYRESDLDRWIIRPVESSE